MMRFWFRFPPHEEVTESAAGRRVGPHERVVDMITERALTGSIQEFLERAAIVTGHGTGVDQAPLARLHVLELHVAGIRKTCLARRDHLEHGHIVSVTRHASELPMGLI